MARGIGDINDLKLVTLNKLIEKFVADPKLRLQNMFGSEQFPSDMIEWESFTGGRGMVPFKAPGSVTPVGNMLGYSKHSAKAAFWGQKMFFDEEFLNNLRQLGTREGFIAARKKIARELKFMTNRCRRRKEWMFSKMLFAGSFAYEEKDGYKSTVSYSIPAANQVTLGATSKWGTGSAKDIIGDIIDFKRIISDSCGSVATSSWLNSITLQYIARDSAIQTLLQKSTFGNGDLFTGKVNGLVGVNPDVLGSLLNIKINIYDELYEARARMTASLATQGTTVYVDEPNDFVVGTAYIRDQSTGTEEEINITAINRQLGTLTVDAVTGAFAVGNCIVVQKVKFCPDNTFGLMADSVEGEPIAEYMEAPYGLERGYGLKADRDETWDPDGIWVRVQDKGLPVLYHRDAIVIATVE